MRETRTHLLLIALAALASGCATSSHRQLLRPSYDSTSPSLVTTELSSMAGHDSPSAFGHWEHSRNDPPVRQPVATYEIAEIRHSETLRTINGRPREYTTTRSRSIRFFGSP